MSETGGGPRRLSAPLLIGILTLPAIFGWLVLRRGYERDLRAAVLVYGAATTAVGIGGQLAP